ncbi:MAG: hypothetical protein ACD_4C00115G0002 [uncultured bacterium (gcode 4)]|uniref:Uncharacterized protein n=1 Tax=uncultured bacterium (gcode 4) TaxID=1234023 RepID=K2F716_9BACT|nr:MAG: hypothetical protein ACD_4C00115G0002 [uncultured bacterium (gcode 4)]
MINKNNLIWKNESEIIKINDQIKLISSKWPDEIFNIIDNLEISRKATSLELVQEISNQMWMELITSDLNIKWFWVFETTLNSLIEWTISRIINKNWKKIPDNITEIEIIVSKTFLRILNSSSVDTEKEEVKDITNRIISLSKSRHPKISEWDIQEKPEDSSNWTWNLSKTLIEHNMRSVVSMIFFEGYIRFEPDFKKVSEIIFGEISNCQSKMTSYDDLRENIHNKLFESELKNSVDELMIWVVIPTLREFWL